MHKKFLAWLLTITMALSMVTAMSATASADTAEESVVQFSSGDNSFVVVPDSASLDVTDELTMEAWIKPNGGREWAFGFWQTAE